MDDSKRQEKTSSGNRKWFWQAACFLLVMALSFYTVFYGQDKAQILRALSGFSPVSLGFALFTGLFFVGAEGIIIYYLLDALGSGSFWKCIGYSFIGFFYCGITPSATGGQPMQLYYMRKDGNRLSDAAVVLTVVALVYKFVLVMIGIGMLLFWNGSLQRYLRGYYPLFLLGLLLNTAFVMVLLGAMLLPESMEKLMLRLETLAVKMKAFKASTRRRKKIRDFLSGYQDAVYFLLEHKKKVWNVCLFTFLQRCSVFFLTWIIYRGFSLEGTDMLTVMLLQASVYISVDMLPVPGAQGITELVYRNIFATVFTGGTLMPSLYVARGIGFYFLLAVGMVVICLDYVYRQILHLDARVHKKKKRPRKRFLTVFF